MIKFIPEKLIPLPTFADVYGKDAVLGCYRKSKIPKKILSRIVRILLKDYVQSGATVNGKDDVENSSIEQAYGEAAFQALIGRVSDSDT